MFRRNRNRAIRRAPRQRQNPAGRGLMVRPLGIPPNRFVQPVSKIERTRLILNGEVSTSGGGNLLTAISVAPSSAAEFSAYAALYDEFRVVGGMFHIHQQRPLVTSSSSPENGMLVIAYDFNDATAPTSLADVLSFGNRVTQNILNTAALPVRYPFKYPISGNSTAILWSPTTGTTAYGSIKLASTGLTASTSYIEYLLDIYVEFRGRV